MPSCATCPAIHSRSSERPKRDAYWSVSVRYVTAARWANSDRSGRLSGYASPDANMIASVGCGVSVLGAICVARAAYRGPLP